MAAPMENNPASQNPHIIDELETSFLNCLSLLTSQEYFNVQDSDESKASIENAMQKFLELSRQVEAFFLKKKMLASYQKPDHSLNEDISDLRLELQRKEQLLEKHAERLKRCQMLLQSSTASTGQPVPPPHPPQQSQQQQPPVQQSLPHATPPPSGQQPPGGGAGGASGGPGGPGAMPQYAPHPMQQMPPQGPGMGPPYQGYPGTIHTPPMQGPPPQMQQHPMGMGGRPQAPPSYAQGPLAYLEQTTSNIGMPDRR